MKAILLSTSMISGTIMTTKVFSRQTKQANYDLYDLSTWGSKEKSVIINSLISTIRSHQDGGNTWSNYANYSDVTQFSKDLTIAFQNINPFAGFYKDPDADINKNISWSYVNDPPSGDSLVKNILKKGLLLSFKGIDDGFVGEMTINVQGSV